MLTRAQHPGLQSSVISQGEFCEYHLTLSPLPGEDLAAMLRRLARFLKDSSATIVKQDIFAPVELYDSTLALLNKILGTRTWPITWTDGMGCPDGGIGGMQVTAVAGVAVEPVTFAGRVVGAIYQDPFARHYLLGDLRASSGSGTPGVQTAQTYEQLEMALALKGMTMFNVVRTWFFLDDILGWYDEFNRVRNTFYTERKLIERLVPASTGVGVKNPYGRALVLGAWAVEPLNGGMTVGMLPSPLQCPAPCYGSCFSRAVEIVTPGHRRVMVSGTASIEPGGASIHPGEMQKQVDLTMEVIEAILGTRKLSFADVSRSTAYIKFPKDAAVFSDWCRKHMPDMPAINVRADVCRDELLFELELDALATI